jgi:tetratricopeptide (TPR) repeat protein
MGDLALVQGHTEEAAAHYEASVHLAREQGDRSSLAQGLLRLAAICSVQGNHAQAEAIYGESLTLAQHLGDRQFSAALLNNMGEEARHSKDFERAGAYYRDSQALFQELGAVDGVNLVRCNLGYLAHLQGDDARAAELLHKSLALRQTDFCPSPEVVNSFCFTGLAEVAVARCQFERAAVLFGAAYKLFEVSGDLFDQLPIPDRAESDRAIAAARTQLGDEAFAAAWRAGQAMTLDQAVAYTLADDIARPGERALAVT